MNLVIGAVVREQMRCPSATTSLEGSTTSQGPRSLEFGPCVVFAAISRLGPPFLRLPPEDQERAWARPGSPALVSP